MKFQPGDDIVVKITDENGKVVELINEKMVMIEVKGVRFPAYTDQLDFPYFKMFTEKRKAEKKKIYVDQLKQEKKINKPIEEEGIFLSFIPVYDKDIFDDDVVEKLKVYLINQTNTAFHFNYKLFLTTDYDFELINQINPHAEFYLHDVAFEDISDNPRFQFEFSLVEPNKKKADFYEAVIKLKGKQVFKKIEALQKDNLPGFKQLLMETYPDKTEVDKFDISALGNAGFRMYEVSRSREFLPPARTVVDLHIEKLTDRWQNMDNFEILTLQLQTFETYYDLAIAHHQPKLTIIHGIGSGKLKQELHEILKLKREVKSFFNMYSAQYGDGATEIFFK
ncbi:MAG: Smr/MutS family protein [Ferruginibacter sp.]